MIQMKSIRILAAVSAAALLLTGCGSDKTNSETSSVVTSAQPAAHNLVTLGDSISAGYGLDHPDTERYSALLTAELIKRDDCKWNDYNYAVSGDDSSDLIKRLENGRALHLPTADSIVICIGANNLLGVYVDFVQDMASELNISAENYTDEDFSRVENQIRQKMKNSEQVLADLQTRIDDNLSRLENDLETIYDWVRTRNADADVYIMNIYNPYRGTTDAMLPGMDEPFGDFAQRQIDRANTILQDLTQTHTDLIYVDLAADFNAADPIPIIGGDPEKDSFPDPHPNADGQKLIADVLLEAMRGA